MNLEKLTRRAIHNRRLDAATARELSAAMDRASYLTAEEYEGLRRLGRALRSGEVSRDD